MCARRVGAESAGLGDAATIQCAPCFSYAMNWQYAVGAKGNLPRPSRMIDPGTLEPSFIEYGWRLVEQLNDLLWKYFWPFCPIGPN